MVYTHKINYNLVSGLRRSGTSLLMLCLRTGGVPILGQKFAVHTNFNTPILENELKGNPNGYWEMGGITCLTGLRDNHLLLGMDKDVIKVVADCLYYSEPHTINKIIIMKRPPRYTLGSLIKSETFKENQLGAYIEKATVDLARTMDFIYNFEKPFIVIEYDKLLNDPEKYLKKAHDFIEKGTPQPQVIDKSLKRTLPLEGEIEGMTRLEELIDTVKEDNEADFLSWVDKYKFDLKNL